MARMMKITAIGTAAALLVALLVLGGCPNQLMESLEKMVSEATTTPHLTLKCLNTSTVIQDDDTYYCSTLLDVPKLLDFELSNSGDRDLIVELIEIVPGSGDVGDFSLAAGALPLAVTPGSTNTFEITFEPATIGSKQVEVRIVHNAPEGGGELSFLLEGSAASTDATLSNLQVSEGTLTPTFSSGILAYTVDVLHTVQSIRVTPTAYSADATITVEGTAVASGSTSAQIDLNYGGNDIEVDVTAGGGGGTLGYTIHVTRDDPPSNDATLNNLQVTDVSLNQTFAPGTTEYTGSVPFETTSIDVTAYTNHSEATLKINNNSVNSGEPYSFALSKVGTNTCTILVTAEDKETTKTYRIIVTRRAQAILSELEITALYLEDRSEKVVLDPSFVPTTYAYYCRVNAATESLKVRPTAAGSDNISITVNWNTDSGPISSGAVFLCENADKGHNDLSIDVSAGTGDTKDTRTYTIEVFVPLLNLAVTGQTQMHRKGDDGDLECGINWVNMSADRFQIKTVGKTKLIDDTFTGLEWVPDTFSRRSWNDAVDSGFSAVIEGLDDWRLPNVNELESLLNYSQASYTWLESEGFTDLVGAAYWSSTEYHGDSSYAYYINLSSGTLDSTVKTQLAYVLLVRDMDN